MDVWYYDHTTGSVSLISPAANSLMGGASYGVSSVKTLGSDGNLVGTTLASGIASRQTVWFYDRAAGTATAMGFYDVAHVDPNTAYIGRYSSGTTLLNVNGQSAGTSTRYTTGAGTDGTGTAGVDSWFYDNSTGQTIQIGLTGGVYTSGALQSSAPNAINAQGQVLGYSYRYSGTTQTFADPWVYDPETGMTTELLLPASTLLPSGFFRIAEPIVSNTTTIDSAGDVAVLVGNTDPISSSNSLMAFLYNPRTGVAQSMGPTDAAHHDANGRILAFNDYLTDTGFVGGRTELFSGTTDVGTDAWVFNKATGITTLAGLTGGAYNNSKGSHTNFVKGMTSAGQAFGITQAAAASQYCWFFDPNTGLTTTVGFTDAAHTSSTGQVFTAILGGSASSMNAVGQMTGASTQYAGGTASVGADAWFFDPKTGITRTIGLIDAIHTNSSNAQYNVPTSLNDNGQVVGTSTRYNGSTTLGNDGWYYDPNTDTTYSLNFSTKSDGTANLTFKYLSADGTALGYYEKYNGSNDLGEYAFEFNPITGATDLNLNVANLSDAGWQQLFMGTLETPGGQIVGTGQRTGDLASNSNPFLLTPLTAGDANMDGQVDLSDLSIVLNNFGATTNAWTSGNFDHAATVDLTDLSDVLNNFGMGNGAGAVAAVPEAGTLGLLVVGVSTCLSSRRRSRA